MFTICLKYITTAICIEHMSAFTMMIYSSHIHRKNVRKKKHMRIFFIVLIHVQPMFFIYLDKK